MKMKKWRTIKKTHIKGKEDQYKWNVSSTHPPHKKVPFFEYRICHITDFLKSSSAIGKKETKNRTNKQKKTIHIGKWLNYAHIYSWAKYAAFQDNLREFSRFTFQFVKYMLTKSCCVSFWWYFSFIGHYSNLKLTEKGISSSTNQ